MWEKRRQAAARRRRLIVNDDGAPQYAASNPRAGEGVEGFLSARFQPCVGTQVDSYFWCVADGQDPPFGTRGHPSIGDADAVIIGAARAAGMEIFASLRMNDTHDAFEPKLTYPLKVRRPDLLLGAGMDESALREEDNAIIMRSMWPGLDFAHREVRGQKREYIESICRAHDFDGLELDFGRCPMIFKLGEEELHVETMTGFMRRVREDLDSIGDDLAEARRAGRLAKTRLQVRVSDNTPTEGVTLWINGVPVPSGVGKPSDQATDAWGRNVRAGSWFDTVVETPPLRQGTNEIVVAPGLHSLGRRAATVDMLQVWVRYR